MTNHAQSSPETISADEHDRLLIANVAPPDWRNPLPEPAYNLVVIGAGTAGLVTAAIAASLGAKVALIERDRMGGDCLNTGCVPSKALLSAARIRATMRDAERYGLSATAIPDGDFRAVMARMRRLRAGISHVDSAARFAALDVDVYFGQATFAARDTIMVDDIALRFAKAVIATGARAALPPIPGLDTAGALTNETLFALTSLPRRLGVIGAGPVGCEMAQALARFGSEVTLFEQGPRVLPREDADAAALVAGALQRDGVTLLCDTAIDGVVSRNGDREIRYQHHGAAARLIVDQILVGIGRRPNVEGLGLETAGVAFDAVTGVRVDKYLRTSNPAIFAAGDVCSPFKFTHAADAMAQIVIQNALFPHPFDLGYASTDKLLIPSCTYTSPEVAHVGLSPEEALRAGMDIDTLTISLKDVDRAVLDGETDGFARVHLRKGSDRIIGATIVAAHAGDLISQLTQAMHAGLGLRTLGSTIYPYPTQAEIIRRLAHAWRRTTLTERRKRMLRTFFAWARRRVPAR